MGKDKDKKAQRHENGKDAKILKLTGENKQLRLTIDDLEARLKDVQRAFSAEELALKETVAGLEARLTEMRLAPSEAVILQGVAKGIV